MRFYIFIYALLNMLTLISCKTGSKQMVNEADIAPFLKSHTTKPKKLIDVETEIEFWKSRFKKDSNDIASKSRYASLLKEHFNYSGNVGDLNMADSIYKAIAPLLSVNSSSVYKSMAVLSITRHQFRMADSLINLALKKGDDKYISTLIAFDAAMEVGNYSAAKQYLNSLINKKAFEYLIRAAKYEDHVNGNLEKAIENMEAAMSTIGDKSSSLYVWTKSNLGDMYCHAGNAKKSYQYYLEVLNIDSSDFHSIKGIAWLAFSHDKKATLAKNILTQLQQLHPVPDYDLLLAEIAAYESNEADKEKHLTSFINKTTGSAYGNMYNKYLFSIYSNEKKDIQKAGAIANSEVQLRYTPETISWLAWHYLTSGEKEKSLSLVKSIENKSEEPDVLLCIGKIYAAIGHTEKAKEFLSKLSGTELETGPLVQKEVNDLLKSL